MSEFDEIRPYEAGEMKQAFEDLLNDRQFNVVMKGFAPWLPKGLRNGLLRLAFTGVKTPLDFQKRFMKPVVKWIMRRHTDGCSFDDSLLSVECRTESVEFATAQPAADGTAVANSTLYTLNSKLSEKEIELIQKMSEFGAAVEQAGKDYSPSGIANYCYELTKVFNQFYHDFSILNEPDEQKKAVRLMLAKNVAKIIKNGMGLLGIEVPERM